MSGEVMSEASEKLARELADQISNSFMKVDFSAGWPSRGFAEAFLPIAQRLAAAEKAVEDMRALALRWRKDASTIYSGNMKFVTDRSAEEAERILAAYDATTK